MAKKKSSTPSTTTSKKTRARKPPREAAVATLEAMIKRADALKKRFVKWALPSQAEDIAAISLKCTEIATSVVGLPDDWAPPKGRVGFGEGDRVVLKEKRKADYGVAIDGSDMVVTTCSGAVVFVELDGGKIIGIPKAHLQLEK